MTQPRQMTPANSERLAALEAKVDGALSDVNRLAISVDKLANAVSGVTATATGLASADVALSSRVAALESQVQRLTDQRVDAVKESEARFAALNTQIAQAVTAALREARDSERRQDDREYSKHNNAQNNQLAIILAIVGFASSLLMMILNLVK